MIFGIKTRKELKKEIEDLKTTLSKANFDLPMSRVNVVFDNRPIETIKAVVEISDCSVGDMSDDFIMDILESKISQGLRKYITVESYHDLMKLVYRISGTIKVVIPEGGRKNG